MAEVWPLLVVMKLSMFGRARYEDDGIRLSPFPSPFAIFHPCGENIAWRKRAATGDVPLGTKETRSAMGRSPGWSKAKRPSVRWKAQPKIRAPVVAGRVPTRSPQMKMQL